MIVRAAVGALLLLSTSAAANAEVVAPFEQGYELKVFCTAPKDHVLFGLCLGLVSGYFENFRHECRGDSNAITRPQLADVVLKFYRDNPDRLHGPAFDSASEALMSAFDCTHPDKEKGTN
jgi:hypothetical protein